MVSSNIACAATLSHLHIDSSDLLIEREKMTAIFSGNILLCFDDIKLLGEEVVFYFEDTNIKDIKEIHVHKNIRATEKDGTVLIADEAIFWMNKSELKLTGNVVIEKNQRIMRAREMTFYGKIKDVVLEK